MKLFREVALLAVAMQRCLPTADAFVPSTPLGTRHSVAVGATSVSALVEKLPSLEELNTAPFLQQVQYGAELAETLTAVETSDESDTEAARESLRQALSAQLSHSDGIRGFMVSYLTDMDGSSTALSSEQIAAETDPQVLLETLSGLLSSSTSDKSDDLVSLMCMNVVMPLAMITMHQDPALSEASRMTAARGMRLLGSVVGASPRISANLQAIETVATTSNRDTSDEDDPLVDYWTDFFDKWGYQEPQRKDIAATVQELLSKSTAPE